MRTCSDESQQQKFFAFFVDQQPVGVNVALPFPEPVPGQRIVMALIRQRRIGPEQFLDVEQGLNVLSLLQHEFDVFLELRGPLDRTGS